MGDSCAFSWFQAAATGNLEVIQALKEQCSGLRNEDGETALMLAVRNNAMNVVEVLLNNEAKLTNEDGYTALLIAAEENNSFACSILLAAERDICLNDNSDALILATEAGAMDAICILAPGWPVRRTTEGIAAIDIASNESNLKAVNLLLQGQDLTCEDVERAMLHANEDDDNYDSICSALQGYLVSLGARSSTPGRDVPLELSDYDTVPDAIQYCPSLPQDSLPLAYSALDNTDVAMTKISLEESDDISKAILMPGAVTPISQQLNADLQEVTPTEQRCKPIIDVLEGEASSDEIQPDPTEFYEEKRLSEGLASSTVFQLTNMIQEHNPMSELVKIIDCKDAEIQELRLLIDTLQNRKPISNDARFHSIGQSASQEASNFPEEPPIVISATTSIALSTIDTLRSRIAELEGKLAEHPPTHELVDTETQYSVNTIVFSATADQADKCLGCNVETTTPKEIEQILLENSHLSAKLQQAENEVMALGRCLTDAIAASDNVEANLILQDFAHRERILIDSYVSRIENLQTSMDMFIGIQKRKAKESEAYFHAQLEEITEQNTLANKAIRNLTLQIETSNSELQELRGTIAYLNEENASLSDALKLAKAVQEQVSNEIAGSAINITTTSVTVQTEPTCDSVPGPDLSPDNVTTMHDLPKCTTQKELDEAMLNAILNQALCTTDYSGLLSDTVLFAIAPDLEITVSNVFQAVTWFYNESEQKERRLSEAEEKLEVMANLCENLSAELKEKYSLILDISPDGTGEYTISCAEPLGNPRGHQSEISDHPDSLVLQPIIPIEQSNSSDVSLKPLQSHSDVHSLLQVEDLELPSLPKAGSPSKSIEISFDKDLSASPPVHLQVPLISINKPEKKTTSKPKPVNNIPMLVEDETSSLMLPSIHAGEFRATKLKQIGSDISPTTTHADRTDMQRAHDLQERALQLSHDAVSPYLTHKEEPAPILEQNSNQGDDTPLIAAVLKGQNSEIRRCLQYAGRFNGDGVTALMIAAMRNNLEAAQLLVEYEKGLTTADGSTALCLALLKGNMPAAKFLTPYEGLDFSHVSSKGRRFTELMQAADEDNIVAVWCLIPHQGGLRDEEGFTALMYAVQAGHYEVARILYELEGRVRNVNGETALMLAAASGFTRIANMLVIKEAGERDNQGRTALMRAAIYNHCDVIRLLLQKEGGIQDSRGETALMFAAKANNPEAVRLLLDKEGGKRMLVKQPGRNGTQLRGPGYTALIQAVRKNSIACIPLLLSREAGFKDAEGRAPILFAKTKETRDLLLRE
ncbi:Ankyrin repeat protein [Giardia duodenalis]|uniref:Ankyrin repeat protein n=1 Tax=Giardia intestinalis TaxID=5741 RepID=V6TC18_GIAIN|nr:Ankyrin repeat protein [Giardia intestinalis]